MNRNDMYNTYSNEKFCYFYPISFSNQNREYLLSKCPIAASWFFGDTPFLAFMLVDEEIDFLKNSNIKISFFNFRGEEVYQKNFTYDDIDKDTKCIYLEIDEETSTSIFIRGIYKCSITMEKDEVEYQTILPKEYCKIYVR